VGVLVSPGGTGKSMLALGLAATVAAGEDAWGLAGINPPRGPVLILSIEDPAIILGRRIRALEASRPGLVSTAAAGGRLQVAARQGTGFALGTWDGGRLKPSPEYEVLVRELAELRPRLLVIDTLNRALAGMDENDNSIQGAVHGLIERLIAPTSTAALVLHHTSKGAALSGQGDIQQSARGAGAITDNARFQCNLTGMTEKQGQALHVDIEKRGRWVQLAVSKSNYAATPPARWLVRGNHGVLEAEEPGSSAIPAIAGRRGKSASKVTAHA
jgi:RecA-family ATPase